jgi:hypothetical protein
MATYRKGRIKRQNPVKRIKQKLLNDFGVVDIELKEVTSSDDLGFVVEDDKIVVAIPELKGSNAKLWEGIFMALAVWGPKDKNELKILAGAIYEIYKTTIDLDE